jgi:hypothetical protein
VILSVMCRIVDSAELSTSFQGCFWIIAVISTIFPCSLALGNVLIIARVVHLWDYNRVRIVSHSHELRQLMAFVRLF